jgi:hypothetical protein
MKNEYPAAAPPASAVERRLKTKISRRRSGGFFMAGLSIYFSNSICYNLFIKVFT